MAVGLRIKFDGGTEEQYKAIHSHMRIDENSPDGMMIRFFSHGIWGRAGITGLARNGSPGSWTLCLSATRRTVCSRGGRVSA